MTWEDAVLLILSVITDGNIETTSMRCSDLNVPWHMKFLLPLIVSLFLYSCTGYHIKTAQPKGVYHRVRGGDTLWNIARAYKINIQDLAEVNNITDPNLIEVGSVIFIPDANQIVDDVITSAASAEATAGNVQREKRISPVGSPEEEPKIASIPTKSVKSPPKNSLPDKLKLTSKIPASGDMNAATPAKSESYHAAKIRDQEEVSKGNGKISIKQGLEQKSEGVKYKDSGGESEKIKFDRDRFSWPVKGRVRSKFGIQPNGMYHNGIRISAKEGTPVFAADSGTVIFSAPLKDYGETIIIKHEDSYATVYTHLSSRVVKVDDQVKRGGRIALLGQLERKKEAYINFEIRYKNKARNPLFFLP
jgi:lipoprotein NlpD